MAADSQRDFHLRCINCMALKGDKSKCPVCGYDESKFIPESLYLQPRTLLFGQYLCGLPLGKGGFGITYIGWDAALERKVAIKEFFPSALATRLQGQSTVMANSTEEREFLQIGLRMFLDEARRVAQFHEVEGIVTVHNFFEANNTAYMVMEYLAGSDLHAYLQKHGGRLSVEETLRLMRPVLEALKRIHAAKVYHRDISTQNIIITERNQLKLIDFGAAKYTVRERSDTVRVVKPGYSPLEQYSSRGSIGPWTDIYAVGATLYLLMSGELPPESPDRLYQDDLIPLAERAELSVPEHISQAVLHCLAVKADDRYQSVEALEAALWPREAAQPTRPLAAAPPPPTVPLTPATGGAPNKSKLAIGLAAGVGGLVALGLAAFLFMHGPTPPAPTPKPPSPPAPVAVKPAPKPTPPGPPPVATAPTPKPTPPPQRASAPKPKPKPTPPPSSLSSAENQRAQRLLTALGLYSGPAHGRWDRASQDAAKRFQRSKGLSPTGRLDQGLLQRLAEEQRFLLSRALDRGDSHLAAKQLDAAEGEYKKARQLDPQSHRAQQGLWKVAVLRKAPLDHGYLSLNCYPKASVYFNGRLLGSTPLSGVKLPVGSQVLEVRAYGATQKVTVSIQKNQTTRTQATLTGGALSVNSSPAAEIFLDGIPLGYTPLTRSNLYLGPHVLSARLSGYRSQETNVVLRRGRTVNIRFQLVRTRGED
ncbi:MAG: protein kinase [Thermodesulfobacteriota bacterium]